MISVAALFEVDKTCVNAVFDLPDKIKNLVDNNAFRDFEVDKYFKYKNYGFEEISLGFHEPVHMCGMGVPALIRQGYIPFAEDHHIEMNWYVDVKNPKHPIYGILQKEKQMAWVRGSVWLLACTCLLSTWARDGQGDDEKLD